MGTKHHSRHRCVTFMYFSLFSRRLASSFEKRLKRDQRSVENTVELNTPSDVQKDFNDFFDGDRIDACDKIETTLSPTEDIDVQIRYLACIIFVVSMMLHVEAP